VGIFFIFIFLGPTTQNHLPKIPVDGFTGEGPKKSPPKGGHRLTIFVKAVVGWCKFPLADFAVIVVRNSLARVACVFELEGDIPQDERNFLTVDPRNIHHELLHFSTPCCGPDRSDPFALHYKYRILHYQKSTLSERFLKLKVRVVVFSDPGKKIPG
jgi:hypothetical protein